MKSLDGEVLIPTQIARNSEIRSNHISKVLSELKAHELVECINPEVRKGRLYRLTSDGE
jgi:DNA-binding IscR family transcriptional regulator